MKIRRLIAASLLLLAMMSLSSIAFAKDSYPPPLGDKTVRNPATDPSDPSANSATLPFTGADAVVILLVGFALIGTGTVLVRRFRVREEI